MTGPQHPVGGFAVKSGGRALQAHCYRHPSAATVAACGQCAQSVCKTCLVLTPDGSFCPPCAALQRSDTASLRGKVVMWTGMAAFMAGVAIYLMPSVRTPEQRIADHNTDLVQLEQATRLVNGVDYGPDTYAAMAIKKRLAANPCDVDAAHQLGLMEIKHADVQGAMATAHAYEARCPFDSRLLEVSVVAHETLGQLDDALKDAQKLLDLRPNAEQWHRVGSLQLKRGNTDEALAALQHANALNPLSTRVQRSLADAYVRVGQPCRSLLPLNRVWLVAQGDDELDALEDRMDTVALENQCPPSSTGSLLAEFKDGPPWTLTVRGAKGVTVPMQLNAGVAYVLVDAARASALGVVMGTQKTGVMVQGDVLPARLGTLPELNATLRKETLHATQVTVAVVDVLPEGLGPQLGQSFLEQFTREDTGDGWQLEALEF